MASIKQTAQSILDSKVFKQAIETGDTKDLESLLVQFGYIVYERTLYSSLRVYGKNKLFNQLTIKAQLKAMPPPCDLYLSVNLSPEPIESQS